MRKRIISLATDMLIVLLTVSMLFLAYLYAAKNVTSSKDDSSDFDRLWIVDDGDGRAFKVFDTSLCTPMSIAYKDAGKDAGILIGDGDLTLTLYAVLSDLVLDVFGNTSICTKAENTTAVTDEILASDSYLYIEYANDLPFPFIYALSSGKSSVDRTQVASGENAYLSRLFMLLKTDTEGKCTYKTYAFDRVGNAYSFTRADRKDYVLNNADKVHLDAYSDVFINAELSRDTASDAADITYGSILYSQVTCDTEISYPGFSTENGKASFLDIFEMNSEKAGSYIDVDGNTVFIGSDVRLSVSASGNISYTSESEPIFLKELLGYSPVSKGEYSMFDMLKATNIFVERIVSAYPTLSSSEADIKLSSVYKNESGMPVFEYAYYFEGIRINTDTAFSFTFDTNGIRYLDINLCRFNTVGEKQATLPKRVVSKRTAKLGRENLILPTYNESNEGIYDIAWIAD